MDEARFGRISAPRYCWCPKPICPVCQMMVSQEYTYAYAVVSVSDDKMDSLILPYVNGCCMQIFLEEVAGKHPGNRLFDSIDALENHLETALRNMENTPPHRVHSIVAWPWIINAL